MNSQFGNHNYDKDHDRSLTRIICSAPFDIRKKVMEEAELYGWSRETIASEILKHY